MITNEKQYKITKAQADKFYEALNKLNSESLPSIPPVLAKAQSDALKSLYEDLKEQVTEYEMLKSGKVCFSEANNFDELPLILVKARIAQGLTQTELAEKLNLKTQQIQRYEADLYSSASFRRLSDIARVLKIKIKDSAEFTLRPSVELASCFPVKEMYERGWFTNFNGSLKQALQNAEDLLSEFFYAAQMTEQVRALHKRTVRANKITNDLALKAWQARIVQKAFFRPLDAIFDPKIITEQWLKGLVSLSREDNGPRLAKDYIEKVGIQVIVEEHLSGTLLDGAAIRGADDTPIIALTIRHDRIDNFWFVLLHELGHILKHLYSDKSAEFFDDLDSLSTDAKEDEADKFALETLIPKHAWESSPVRFFAHASTIKKQAENWGISEAIIAGRIRQENKDWTSPELAKLVGHGKVRHLFIEG